MALDQGSRDAMIKEYRIGDKDTGSAPVQIILLTYKIELLSLHLRNHTKDYTTNRSLTKKVSQRKRLLKKYLADNEEACRKLQKTLAIR